MLSSPFNEKSPLPEIWNFLLPHEKIWQKEILNFYPYSLQFYPEHWLSALDLLTEEQLWNLDCHQLLPDLQLPNDLLELLNNLKNFSPLKLSPNNPYCIPNQFNYQINKKKSHELSLLIPILQELIEKHQIDQVFDLGAGKGILAHLLSRVSPITTITMDQNLNLIQKGIKLSQRYNWEKNPLHFVHEEFNEEFSNSNFITPSTLAIGLHSCGNLSNILLKKSIEHNAKVILNFGCCYLRLNDENQINSKLGKNINIKLSTHALSLATRGYESLSLSDFRLKMRVKSIRYTFHLFLNHELGIKDFAPVGEIKPNLYLKPFSWYAQQKLKELNLFSKFSETELDSFYHSPPIQNLVKKINFANLLRWQFGSLVERLILEDRKQYLLESNYLSQLINVFDKNISPRNTGLLGIRK